MENSSSKWYHNPILVNVLLIVFFPIGLVLLWMSDRIAKWWKVTASVIIGLLFLFNMGSDDNEKLSSEQPYQQSNSASTNTVPELTQAERDSIAKAEREKELDIREKRTLKAENLFYAYNENEIKADQNYKGERFYVEGKIKDFGKDILDDPYITLETGEIFSVQCMLNDENIALDLKKGQKVTFLGTCSGKLGNVLMKDCDFVLNIEDL